MLVLSEHCDPKCDLIIPYKVNAKASKDLIPDYRKEKLIIGRLLFQRRSVTAV